MGPGNANRLSRPPVPPDTHEGRAEATEGRGSGSDTLTPALLPAVRRQ